MKKLHYFKLGYLKDYFNQTQNMMFRQLKMVSNQKEYHWFEQRPIIKYLMVEKFKPCEI